MPAALEVVVDDHLNVQGYRPIGGHRCHYEARHVIGQPLSEFGWVIDNFGGTMDAIKKVIRSGVPMNVRYQHRLSGLEIARVVPIALPGWAKITVYSSGRG
jgi:hypothetical protein